MATTRVNLIGNDGSLENGTLVPIGNNGSISYSKVGYSSWGERSMSIKSTNAAAGSSAAIDGCPVAGRSSITVSYDIVNDSVVASGSQSFSTYVVWRDPAGAALKGASAPCFNGTSTSPSRVVAKFTDIPPTATTASIYLGLMARAVGSYSRFDNIWVDDGDTDGSWPYPKSPLPSAGNYDKDPAAVISRGTVKIVTPSAAGGGYGDGVGEYTATDVNSYVSCPLAPIVPGQTVTIAFDIKDPKLTAESATYVTCNFFDGAITNPQTMDASHPDTITHLPAQGGGELHRVAYTFTAPQGAAMFNAAIAKLGVQRVAGDVFYIDRLSIEVGLAGEIPPGVEFPYPDITTGDYCLINDERTGDLWFTLNPGSVRLGGPKIVIQNDNGYSTLEWDIVVNPGESLVVDCQEKTAKINGVNYPPIVREWPVLATGENWFSLRAAEVSTGATMDITYHLGS